MKKGFSKEYKKMMKKNRKALNQINKNADPFDYNDGLAYLIAHLRWMKDYYALGENVWAMEERDWNPDAKDEPTRLESLTQVLEHYDAWQGAEDKYIKCVEHDHGEKEGVFSYHFEYLLGDREATYKALEEEKAYHRAMFFQLLSQYMESWWD